MPPDPPDNAQGKISRLPRVLVWILFILSILTMAGIAFVLFKYRHQSGNGTTVSALLLIILMAPVWAYAAIKGRSPRWLSSAETAYDDEAKKRGIEGETTGAGSGNIISIATTAIIFGLFLIFFGRSIGVFESDTGWFAGTVFFIAWLIVVVILWRNARKRKR
jgi:hypothetical protein